MTRVSSMFLIQRDPNKSGPMLVWLARRATDAAVYPGRLEGPGGKASLTERAIDCAYRELYEETGLSIEDETRFVECGSLICRRPPNFDVKVSLYLVELMPGERPTNPEPMKRGDWHSYELSRYWLSNHGDDMTIATETLYRIALINLGLEG